MSRSRTRSSKKKTVTIAVLVACLLLAAIGGTIAWLTARDSLTNQFTVGDFNDPTTDPTDPEGGEIPEGDKNPDAGKLNGHLYEPNWDKDNNKLVPGGTIDKDPYVGIGEGSESAVVYVYVKNTATTEGKLYFKLNRGWEAIDAPVVNPGKSDPGYEENANYYSSGLFKYTAGLTASADNDEWTSMPVFNDVFVMNNATSEDLAPAKENDVTCLKVTALLHQKLSGNGTAITSNEIESWVNYQKAELAAETIKTTP